MIVGVAFESQSLRGKWLRALAGRLDADVVDVDDVDAEAIDVLVVGNPLGSSLQRFTGLGLIQSTWAGVDRLVVDSPSVPIARMVAPELTAAMTDFVVMCVQMAHRRVPLYLRDQKEQRWEPRPQAANADTAVGIAGFGELGRPAASALSALGFDVMAWARSARSDPIPVVAGADGMATMLARSDVLVNLLPLTPSTAGIFDAAAFASMKTGATFVNLARGGHVVEADLLAALDLGRPADAILDVFTEEPLPRSHPFWSHDRVIVFPHVAAFSNPEILIHRVIENLNLYLSGQPPHHLI